MLRLLLLTTHREWVGCQWPASLKWGVPSDILGNSTSRHAPGVSNLLLILQTQVHSPIRTTRKGKVLLSCHLHPRGWVLQEVLLGRMLPVSLLASGVPAVLVIPRLVDTSLRSLTLPSCGILLSTCLPLSVRTFLGWWVISSQNPELMTSMKTLFPNKVT